MESEYYANKLDEMLKHTKTTDEASKSFVKMLLVLESVYRDGRAQGLKENFESNNFKIE